VIRELSTYRWKKDRNENLLPEPLDENNHALDAISYALAGELTSRPVVGYARLQDPYE
jgi:phage terminase large subunit